VRQYGDDLYSWACHKVSDDQLAEDLVQETFLSAFQSLESFQGKSNPKTWLFSILNNKIIDHYRKSGVSIFRFENPKEKRGVDLTDSMFGKDGRWIDKNILSLWSNESSLLDDADFTSVMTKCMNDLPENWKTMVTARYLLEKESREICQELNMTPSNYWQVLHRAKLMLKKCIEIYWFNR
jgi:RNA polymerase sigma-70 factor (TIGR02943 family)